MSIVRGLTGLSLWMWLSALHAQIVQQMLFEHLALLLGQQLGRDCVDQIEGQGEPTEGGPHAQGQPAQQTRTQAAIQLPQQAEPDAEPRQGARHVGYVGDGDVGRQLRQIQLPAVERVGQVAGDCG